MELWIEFTCPACGTLFRDRLLDLHPGRKRLCSCGAFPELTHEGLEKLERSLSSHTASTSGDRRSEPN